MQHCWYDDNALLDLRFLIAAEPYDGSEGDEASPYSIGCLMEIGCTPQHVHFEYPTRALRDTAFARLIAQHQAWMIYAHAPDNEDDD